MAKLKYKNENGEWVEVHDDSKENKGVASNLVKDLESKLFQYDECGDLFVKESPDIINPNN